MTRWVRVCMAALAVGTGALLGAGPPAPANPMHREFQKLVDDLAAGKDVAKDAAAFSKKYELEDTMSVLKPRRADGKGGLGVGGAWEVDGIEDAFLRTSRRQLQPEEFREKKPHLLRAAQVTAVLAELNDHYTPKGPKKAQLWGKFNAEFKESAQGLIKAVDNGDPAQVRRASTRLVNACGDCHTTAPPR